MDKHSSNQDRLNQKEAIERNRGESMTTMSLRIEDEQARALNALAMAEEATVSEVIRDAIADLIEKRRGDKDFQERLKRAVERNREALDLLAK
jgi:predicted transcriptional regulator